MTFQSFYTRMKTKYQDEIHDLTNDTDEDFVLAKIPITMYRDIVHKNLESKREEISIRGSWTELGNSFSLIFRGF